SQYALELTPPGVDHRVGNGAGASSDAADVEPARRLLGEAGRGVLHAVVAAVRRSGGTAVGHAEAGRDVEEVVLAEIESSLVVDTGEVDHGAGEAGLTEPLHQDFRTLLDRAVSPHHDAFEGALRRFEAGDASAAVVREIRSDRALDEVGRRSGERVGVVGDSSSEPSAVSGDDASFEARVGSELDAEPTSLKGGGAILDHASDQSG